MQHPSQRKEIPSPPANTASCREKRQQLENTNCTSLVNNKKVEINIPDRRHWDTLKGPGWGPYVPGYWLS